MAYMQYGIERIFVIALAICISTGGFLAASIVNPDDSFDHVIITSRQIRDASTDYTLHDLAAHRTSNGLRSVIVAVEDIYGNYSGRDDAEKVRHFIIDARDNWGADYFLLGGKPHIVPARVFYMTDTYSFPSDFYYAALEGCFNTNNNDRWGEWPDDNPAQYADVKVGRIPADNAGHVANFVYKVIRYETSPPDASYHSKAVLWTEPDVGQFPSRGTHNDWDQIHNARMTTVEQRNNVGAHSFAFPRMGSGNYGLFIGGGHGWGDISCGISTDDVNTLNNQDRYFLYTSISCFSGVMDQENSFNERLVVGSRQGGAFATMLNSHYGYPPQISWMQDAMIDSYFSRGNVTLGALLNDKRLQLITRPGWYDFSEYITRWTIYAYNLFGDPATPFRMKFSTGQDAWFAFQEGSGDYVIDEMGNFETGILVGGADRVGDGIGFDGSSGYIEIADSKWAPMGNQAEVTVMAWINPSAQEGIAGIVTKGHVNQSFGLGLTQDLRISFSANSGHTQNGIGSGIWYSNASVPQDQWSHVAVSYDHFHNQLTFYVNGALDRTVSQELYFGYVSEPLIIGRDFRQSSGYYNGLINEVQIFSRVVPATEILADPMLKVYGFDDGSLQGWTEVATDSQGRQYFGVVPPAVGSPNVDPHLGSHFVGLHIPAFTWDDPVYTQDSPHDTLVLSSPEFLLNGGGDMTLWLSGGGAGSPDLAGMSVSALPSTSVDGGFRGVALRDVTTGIYLLSGTKTSDGGEWEQIVFPASQLAVLPQDHVYTLDLIDAAHGGWGWINMDSVTIPGTIPGAEPAAPPTISAIADQTIFVDTGTGALSFTVGSTEIDPGTLTLSGSSSNAMLVPTANIVFGGSGANRTVTVTPAAGQLGKAMITIIVSDGEVTAGESFALTVLGDPALMVFDFWDGETGGWSEVMADGFGRQYFAVVPPSVSSPNITPHSGDNFIGLHIPAFGGDPFYFQDSPHETLLFRSPEFRLNGAGDLTAWLSGGGAGSSLPGPGVSDLPSSSVEGGFRGIALRDVATGAYVLSGTKASDGGEWEQVVITAAQLAALPQGRVYTLDLIDAAHGGWGWVNMDTVTIPGTIPGDEPVVPDVPVLVIGRSGENEVRLSWPATIEGWTLQRSAEAGGEYISVGLPVIVEGDENVAYDTLLSHMQFYRLVN